MKAVLAIFAVLGVLSGACLVAWQGFAAVGDALEMAGLPCLAAICAFQIVPLSLCALAWRALFKKKRPEASSFIWFRWMRDAGGDILGIVPAGGEMISIRAMTRRGIAMTDGHRLDRGRPHHGDDLPGGVHHPGLHPAPHRAAGQQFDRLDPGRHRHHHVPCRRLRLGPALRHVPFAGEAGRASGRRQGLDLSFGYRRAA